MIHKKRINIQKRASIKEKTAKEARKKLRTQNEAIQVNWYY